MEDTITYPEIDCMLRAATGAVRGCCRCGAGMQPAGAAAGAAAPAAVGAGRLRLLGRLRVFSYGWDVCGCGYVAAAGMYAAAAGSGCGWEGLHCLGRELLRVGAAAGAGAGQLDTS